MVFTDSVQNLNHLYLNSFPPFIILLPIKINILGILELQMNETYLKWCPDTGL